MNWTDQIVLMLEKSWKALVGLAVVLVGVGVAYQVYQRQQDKKLEAAATELYEYQKQLGELAEKLNPAPPEGKEPKTPVKTATPEESKAAYAPVVAELQKFIAANHGTQPAVEGALVVAEAASQYNEKEEGVKALSTALKGFTTKSFLYGVAQNELGVLYAETNRCEEAVKTWEKVLGPTEHAYLSDSVRLKMGVCFQKLNQWEKAEAQYEELVKKSADSASGRSAKKLLLYLKQQKQSTAKG